MPAKGTAVSEASKGKRHVCSWWKLQALPVEFEALMKPISTVPSKQLLRSVILREFLSSFPPFSWVGDPCRSVRMRLLLLGSFPSRSISLANYTWTEMDRIVHTRPIEAHGIVAPLVNSMQFIAVVDNKPVVQIINQTKVKADLKYMCKTV